MARFTASLLLFALGCGPDAEPLHRVDVCPATLTADTLTERDGVLLLHAELWHTTGRAFAKLRVDGRETRFLEPGESQHGVHLSGVRRTEHGIVADYCRVTPPNR